MNTIRFLLTCGTSTAILNSLYLSNAALNGHTEAVRLLLSRGAAWNAAWRGGITDSIEPNIRSLLLATFTLRRWVRSRLMRLRLHRIPLLHIMHRLCIELQYSPPKGPFKGGVKYIESKESFQKRGFWLKVGL